MTLAGPAWKERASPWRLATLFRRSTCTRTPQKLVLKLEVPGIRREDLDIRIEGRNLTVRGERKFESEEKEENFHRIERRYGSFVRSFTLPATIDTESVDAQSTDGVLTISLAKKPEAKPKQIQVKVGSTSEAPKQVEAHSAKPQAA